MTRLIATLFSLSLLAASSRFEAQTPAVDTGASAAPSAVGSAAPASSEEQGSVSPSAAAAPGEEMSEAEAELRELIQPADGEWLIDDQGRSYFLRLHPKTAPFKRLGESRVRIRYGGQFDLAGEDETNLWLKVYRPSDTRFDRPDWDKEPTPEELAASAATFVAPKSAVDRLRLEAFDSGLPQTGLWRNGFDLADINGDGKIDFVHGPMRRGGDQPRIFTGDGHGVWTPYKASVPPGILDYGDVKVADFNRDGKADLAAAMHLRGVAAFLGDGSGKFTPWSEGLDFDAPGPSYTGLGFSSRRIEVLDWNKDGRPDLLALSEGPRISTVDALKPGNPALAANQEIIGPRIYLNDGDGSWTKVENAGKAPAIFGDDLAIADFDRNGSPDFVTAANMMGSKNLLNLQGKKVGGAWTPVDLPVRPRAYVHAVAAADFDGDRSPDVAMTYISFELGVARVGLDLYLSRRDKTWERRPVFSREGRVGLSALGAGDIDGDGRQDLAATDQDGYLFVFLGDGRGSFATETSPEGQQTRGRCRGYDLRVMDLDGDGKGEIAASFAGEANALYDPLRCPSRGGVAVWSPKPVK